MESSTTNTIFIHIVCLVNSLDQGKLSPPDFILEEINYMRFIAGGQIFETIGEGLAKPDQNCDYPLTSLG